MMLNVYKWAHPIAQSDVVLLERAEVVAQSIDQDLELDSAAAAFEGAMGQSRRA